MVMVKGGVPDIEHVDGEVLRVTKQGIIGTWRGRSSAYAIFAVENLEEVK